MCVLPFSKFPPPPQRLGAHSWGLRFSGSLSEKTLAQHHHRDSKLKDKRTITKPSLLQVTELGDKLSPSCLLWEAFPLDKRSETTDFRGHLPITPASKRLCAERLRGEWDCLQEVIWRQFEEKGQRSPYGNGEETELNLQTWIEICFRYETSFQGSYVTVR